MKTLTLDLPKMYGDHHVLEVRRILLALPGVKDVYASSAFQSVEIIYEPTSTDDHAIQQALETAGYLDNLEIPAETGTAAYARDGEPAFFRHTVAYQQVGQMVSFAQKVSYSGRPLWPCPGIGVVQQVEKETPHG